MTKNEDMLTFSKYKFLVLSDLYRITRETSFSRLIQYVLFGESFKYIFWMRSCRFMRGKKWLKYTIYPLSLFMLQHYQYKFGIGIPFLTEIGPGFYIGHFGGIFIYPDCKIGKNCNLSQGVTIGNVPRGKNKGYPTIGDNVYIGPGAKVIGCVKVGDRVAIGANCVVTKDVPNDAVVVGVPGKVISFEGSEGYICNTDYSNKFRIESKL